MKFYVVDKDYKPLSDAHDELHEAAEYALDQIINLRAVAFACVLGMDSDTFRTNVPAPILLRINAGFDLERF